jgi:hypothetical protein
LGVREFIQALGDIRPLLVEGDQAAFQGCDFSRDVISARDGVGPFTHPDCYETSSGISSAAKAPILQGRDQSGCQRSCDGEDYLVQSYSAAHEAFAGSDGRGRRHGRYRVHAKDARDMREQPVDGAKIPIAWSAKPNPSGWPRRA